MDSGVISHRYAKVFYKFASERKEEDLLREELKLLSEQFLALPLLQKTLNDPTISSAAKIDLLTTACGKDISDTCSKALRLIVENKRTQYIRPVLLIYEEVYRKAKGLVAMKLISAEPASSDVKNQLVDLVKKDNAQVEFITETNEDLIGGFILEVNGLRLDASIRNLLDKLRLELLHY